MSTHWFVVANQKAMKVFNQDPETQKMVLIDSVENPLGGERRRALIRKQAGIGVKSLGTRASVRYSESKRRDPMEMALDQFAKKIARYLERQKQRDFFVTLTVAAEPHFLGKIRAAMSDSMKKQVRTWVKKDLQKTPVRDLGEALVSKKRRADNATSRL